MIRHINEKAGLIAANQPLYTGFFSESVQLLQHLIAIPSFSGEEHEAADLLQQYLETLSIKVHRQDNNIWCHNKYYDHAKPTILLNSHLDTVKPNEGYTLDPFFPEIDGGRLYGLGSNDAGGCLVSLVAAFIHFYSYKGLSFNLCLAATAEEENSGNNGIKSILPLIGPVAFAIVGEPTLLQMAVEEKGNLVIDCVSIGCPGHAARDEGDNAIYKCMHDLEWFRNYQFPSKSKNQAPVKMTVTGINAGIQHNIVPGKCSFMVDIRHDSSYTQRQILEVISDNINSQITPREGSTAATSIALSHPIVKTGVAIGCKTYVSPTSSDRAWLTVPSVKVGPGDSSRSHSADEFIFLKEIKDGINFYIKLLESLPLTLVNNPTNVKMRS